MSPTKTTRALESTHPEIYSRNRGRVGVQSINRTILIFFAFNPLISIITSMYFNINGKYLFTTIMIVITFINIINPKKKLTRVKSYLVYLVLMILYLLIINLATEKTTFATLHVFSYSNWAIQSFCILYIIENTDFDEKYVRMWVKAMFAIAIIATIVSFIQLQFSRSFLAKTNEMDFRISNYYLEAHSIYSYIDRTSIGFDFIPMMAALIGWSVYNNKQLIYLFEIAITGFVSMASSSRYIMLGALLAYTQFFYLKIHRLKKILWLFGGLLGVIFVIILFSYIFQNTGRSFDGFINNRILSRSALTRIEAFSLFKKHFSRNIWLGTGGDMDYELLTDIRYGQTSQIHVGYLSFLYRYGLFGGFLFFGLNISLVMSLFIESRFTKYYGGLFAFLVIIVNYLTIVHYSLLSTGFAFGMILHKYFYIKKIEEINQMRAEEAEQNK